MNMTQSLVFHQKKKNLKELKLWTSTWRKTNYSYSICKFDNLEDREYFIKILFFFFGGYIYLLCHLFLLCYFFLSHTLMPLLWILDAFLFFSKWNERRERKKLTKTLPTEVPFRFVSVFDQKGVVSFFLICLLHFSYSSFYYYFHIRFILIFCFFFIFFLMVFAELHYFISVDGTCMHTKFGFDF